MGVDFHAFTTSAQARMNRLVNEVTISYNGSKVTVPALWDTGATRSAISHEVRDSLNLIPTGKCRISTPNGSSDVDTYCVDATLPNNVNFSGIIVSDSEIGTQNIGMLVGMDIIGQGDFAVSNHNGKTVFSYRYPSSGVTDFVKQFKVSQKIGPKHGVKQKRSK